MTTTHELRRHRDLWPESINTIAEVIGDEATAKIFILFSGRYVRMPVKGSKSPRANLIKQTIGEQEADLLFFTFSGEILNFPNAKFLTEKGLIKIRNKRIVSDSKRGMSQGDIAAKNGLTHRTVNKIINQSRKSKCLK